jgi:hypothetical protein
MLEVGLFPLLLSSKTDVIQHWIKILMLILKDTSLSKNQKIKKIKKAFDSCIMACGWCNVNTLVY